MGTLQDLLRWAIGKGIILNGIQPSIIHGRGIGVLATRKLKADEVVLTIPAQAIHSLSTVSRNISEKLLPDVGVQCVLAVEMIMAGPELAPWRAVMPARSDLEATLPFMWPEGLQKLLPAAAQDLLNAQKAKVAREWEIVARAFPGLRKEDYEYAWFVVGTRTFYWVTPELEKYTWDDRLSLLPIADLFNHANEGCKVSFSEQGYEVCTDCTYDAGEEVYSSYGEHSNDFLLAEYGFILPKNPSDEVRLDSVILPRLSTKQKDELQEKGFLGNYVLCIGAGVCNRTQETLRMLCCGQNEQKDSLDRQDNGHVFWEESDGLLVHLLELFVNEVGTMLDDLRKLKIGHKSQRELVARRWEQIQSLLSLSIQNLSR